MKKKLISTLLMGAFVVASTSMFVSCKNYDDDISDLKTQISTNKTAVDGTVSSLQTEVNTLKTQLEAKSAELATAAQTAKDAQAKAADASAEIAKVNTLAADVATLTARIETANKAIDDLNKLVAGAVSQETYDAEVKKIYGEVEAVQTGLGEQLKSIEAVQKGLADQTVAIEAVKADLAQQKTALDNYKAELEKYNLGDMSTQIAAANQKIAEIESTLASNYDVQISDMKSMIAAVDEQVSEISQNITVLNVMINRSLSSLVFNPDEYYHGIEATSFKYLEAFKYNLPNAAWNIRETRGAYGDSKEKGLILTEPGARTMHNRYDSTAVALTNELWANYYMNPSSCNGEDIKELRLLSGDKDFINTRSLNSADAKLSVNQWKAENGMLKVQIDIDEPAKLKAVIQDYWAKDQEKPMVTVFATQAIVKKGENDTTITSDFATLYADKMAGVRLAHVLTAPSFTKEYNEHCGACPLVNKDKSHLMATVHEAVTFKSQDQVNYKSTLDLRTLVETHWNNFNADGKLQHVTMSATDFQKYGFDYKFELTSVKMGDNETDESAHAAILGDGYTFRPQNPRQVNTTQYEQVAWDAEDVESFIGENALQSVGRTPVVRVSLVDTIRGNVLDYGYIRILITKEEDPYIPPTTWNGIEVPYPGADKTIQDICPEPVINGYAVYETKWIQTSYDIYNALKMTRDEFTKHYAEDPVRDANTDFAQFYKAGTDEDGNPVYKQRLPEEYIGVFTNTPDLDNETHTQTSTLKWEITKADLVKLYNQWAAETKKSAEKTYALTAAVMYEDIDGHKGTAKYKDVYVVFSTNVTFKPAADGTIDVEVDWSNAKTLKYWYQANTNTMGVKGESQDEIHVNVPSVEDDRYTELTHDNFFNQLSDEFVNNEIVNKNIVKGAGFVYDEHKYHLIFDAANNGKKFKGASGATYTLRVSGADNTVLQAVKNGETGYQDVAILTVNDPDQVGKRDEPNYTDIKYIYTDNACDLLNYASHTVFATENDMVGQFLNAIVSLSIDQNNECQPIKLKNSEFNVRFLRPLDITDGHKTIEDASADGHQYIYLDDLFKFSDWRDQWGTVEKSEDYYYNYYGIKGLSIPDVFPGDNISNNLNVMASLNSASDDDMVPLYTISGNLKCTYNIDGNGKAYLDYQNLSSTLNEFKLRIPVVVEYVWGKLYTTATVTVKKTKNNARRQ